MAQALSNVVPKTPYTGLFSTANSGLKISNVGSPTGGYANPSNSQIAGLLTNFKSAPASGMIASQPTQQTNIQKAPVSSNASAVNNSAAKPITGVTTTPSGAQVNATTGQVLSAPAQTSGSRGLFQDVLSSLANYNPYNNQQVSDAYKKAQQINEQIAQSKKNQAEAEATNRLNPIPIGDQTGREAVLRNQYLAQQNALASELQGQSNLFGAGVTASGQTLSGLGTAASQAAPQVTSYGQTSFNPVTGQFDGGGSIPSDVMQQYAQMAASGQYAAIPSFITSNPVLNAQLNAAAKMVNPNYNPAQATAVSNVLSSVPALKATEAQAEGIKNTIQNYLSQNPTLNANELAAGNLVNQWLQGKQLADPKYQTLFNYLTEYTNTIGPILGANGDVTNFKQQLANSFINAAASGQSISQVLNAMSSLAANKIADLQSGALGGGTTVSPSGSTGGFAEAW